MPRKTTTKRSARSPERRKAVQPSLMRRAVGAAGQTVARNPALVGGGTAFFVAMFYISANALWYQPHLHGTAFFSTRGLETRRLPPMPSQNETNPGDPVISGVQNALRDLRLYAGETHGRADEATQTAIATYQKIMGHPATGQVDEVLIEQLGLRESTASIIPTPQPRDDRSDDEIAERIAAASGQPVVASAAPEDRVRRIQAGLRAFGNKGIEVDGKMGAKTRAGIEEFQKLFGLEVSGEADAELHTKMREIGLTD